MSEPTPYPGGDNATRNPNDASDGVGRDEMTQASEKLIAEFLAWLNSGKSNGHTGRSTTDGKASGRPEANADKPEPVKLDYQKPGSDKLIARPALPAEKDPQIVGDRQEAAARAALKESQKDLKFTQDNSPPRVFPYQEQFTVSRQQTPMEIAREQLGAKATREQAEAFAREILRLNKRDGDINTEKFEANSTIRLPGQNADGGIVFKDGDFKVTRWQNSTYLTILKDGNGYVSIPGPQDSIRMLEWNRQELSRNLEERESGNTRIQKRADGTETHRHRADADGPWQVVRSTTIDDKRRRITEEHAPGAGSPTKVTVVDSNNASTVFIRNAKGELLSVDGRGISADAKIYRRVNLPDGSAIRNYEDGTREHYDSRANLVLSQRKDAQNRLVVAHFKPGVEQPHRVSVTKPGEQPLEFSRTAAGRYVADYKMKDGTSVGSVEMTDQGQFIYTDKATQIVRTHDPDGKVSEERNWPHGRAKTIQSKDSERVTTERDRSGIIKSEVHENAKDGRRVTRTYDSAGKLSEVVIEERDATTKLRYDRDLDELVGERVSKAGHKQRVILGRDDMLLFPASRDANGDMKFQRIPVPFNTSSDAAGGLYNSDTGTIRYPSQGGTQRIESIAPGRHDVVKSDGTVEGATASGEKSYIRPTGESAVEHADGTKVRLNADGTIDRWGPKDSDSATREPLSKNEREFLDKHRGSIDLRDLAEIHRRFRGDRNQLDEFYKQLGKIDEAKNLSVAEKQVLRRNLMRHVAHPGEIFQGNSFACNVAVVQRDMAINNPAGYVSMVVNAVSEGRIRTAQGEEINVDPNNLKLHDISGRDLGSRIFQITALNVTAHPRKFLNTEDGAGYFIDKSGHRQAFNGLVGAEIADLLHKFSGHEHSFVKINTPEDLLRAFQKNGGRPMVIKVDGSKAPIARDSNSAGHGGHVVTITRIDQGPPMKVYVQNQWGLESDRSTSDRAISAEDLVENMRRRGIDSQALIRGPRLKVFRIDGGNLVEDKEGTKIAAQDFESRKQ